MNEIIENAIVGSAILASLAYCLQRTWGSWFAKSGSKSCTGCAQRCGTRQGPLVQLTLATTHQHTNQRPEIR